MKKMQQGFTLIELMIVVAIIGILAAVAIPQYQDYVTRSKLTGAVSFAQPIQTALAEFAQENGGSFATFPANGWTSLGFPTAPTGTGVVTGVSLTAATGAIVLTLGNLNTTYNNKTVTMTPNPTPNGVTWANTCSLTGDANLGKVFGCP